MGSSGTHTLTLYTYYPCIHSTFMHYTYSDPELLRKILEERPPADAGNLRSTSRAFRDNTEPLTPEQKRGAARAAGEGKEQVELKLRGAGRDHFQKPGFQEGLGRAQQEAGDAWLNSNGQGEYTVYIGELDVMVASFSLIHEHTSFERYWWGQHRGRSIYKRPRQRGESHGLR